METQSEFAVKKQRVQAMLAQRGYDSLIITRRSNFAWFTCGGEAVSSRVSPTSPVYLVITPEKLYAIGYYMDLPNTVDRALDALEVEAICLPTFSKTPEETALEVAVGKVAADDGFLGVDDVQAELVGCHEPFTPQEMARYRELGQAAGLIQRELAEWVRPGITERQVLAQMWHLALEQGMEGHFMFVGSDEHIARYRHPVPTDKPIEKCVLIAPAVAKWGLLVATSRLVFFEPPSEEIRRRFQAIASMHALLIARTKIGVSLNELFGVLWSEFERQGFADEQHNHFHGGPVGYWNSYAGRMQDPAETVQPNMAFTYYLTVTGVKSEELILVDEHAAELVSADPDWPMVTIDVDGAQVAIPDLLVRT